MCLGLCQTQIGSVVEAEVGGWGRTGQARHLRGIPVPILLSRHWTRAGVNSEEWGSPEAGMGNWSVERCQEVQHRACLGAG